MRLPSGISYVVIGNIGAGALGGLFWLVLASISEEQIFGSVNFYLSLSTILNHVALLGQPTTVIVHTAKGNESIKYQSNFLVLIAGLVCLLPLIIFLENKTLGFVMLTSVMFNMALAQELGRKNTKQYAIALIGQRVIQIGLGIPLFILFSYDGIFAGFIAASVAFSIPFIRTIKKFSADFSELKKKFNFSMHGYSMEMSNISPLFSDRILIAPLFGFAVLGLYAFGLQFLLFLSVLPSILLHYLLPNEASGNKSDKLNKYVFAIVVALTALTVVLVPPFITTFFPNYMESIIPAQILSLGAIPMTFTAIENARLLGKGDSKKVLLGSLIFLVTQYVGIVVLGKEYGLAGLGVALPLALSAQAGYLLYNRQTTKEMPS